MGIAAVLITAGAAARGTGSMPVGIAVGEVAIFYYPWYGTPTVDGGWLHWQQNGSTPPGAIASGWYPQRGAYSSSDRRVIAAQMREIAAAGIGTVIVSWWGPASVEDRLLGRVIRLARAAGLHVALHLEPYSGRTPAALEPLIREFGERGITDFYVYDSTTSPDDEWAALNADLAGVRLFANTALPGKAKAGGFAGLYTYDVHVYDGSSFPRMCASARVNGLVCAPSVGPGYDAVRATGDLSISPRANGARYDQMWRAAVRAGAAIVTITSYNEWHEGTQIEPAQAIGPPYISYDGAYGLTGMEARRAYLDRTAMWVARYRQSLAQNKAAASLRR